MGQAKRRGSFEERQKEGVAKREAEAKALQEKRAAFAKGRQASPDRSLAAIIGMAMGGPYNASRYACTYFNDILKP